MDNDNQKKKPNLNIPGKPKGKFNFYWIYGILALIFLALNFSTGFFNTGNEEISRNEFEKYLRQKNVEKILIVNNEFAEVYIKKESIDKDTTFKDLKQEGFGRGTKDPFYIYKFLTIDEFNRQYEKAIDKFIAGDTVGKPEVVKQEIISQYNDVPITPVKRRNWVDDLFGLLWPILLLILFWVVLTRVFSKSSGGGQIFNFGKSRAQLFDGATSVNINFNDVAGLEEAKVEVMEIVDFLKSPKKYTELGGKIPKGALLVGPPGTGKTLLAKAVAGEAKVPFFSISGSDFVEMFVGVGASRVRDLFRNAKEKAPCIIFIDEIDAIGRSRGKNAFTGSNDERENTLNQLLTEMDGFQSNTGVIILAATNRADILDRALLRAGRFDRQIHVELPDIEERKAIFNVHLKPLKLDQSADIEFLAKQTPGFSGADIANVCNEAALIAARKGKKAVEKQDFLDAIDRIIGGLEKRSKIISIEEKRVIAYHESGHAAVSWLLEHAHPLIKVTIVPRGKSLGAAWYLPEERQITTFEQMYDEMTAALAGRAAEKVVFGKVSTGALNDLEKVTKQAFAIVAYYGLNEKIGNLSYYDSTGQSEYTFTKPFSEKTSEAIDSEVREMIERAYQRAVDLLTQNREKLDKLASVLIEKEVIFREDLEVIFGKREFKDPHAEVIIPAQDTVVTGEELKTETESSCDEKQIE